MNVYELSEVFLKKGYLSKAFETRDEAVQYVLENIPVTSTIGVGGSVTIRDLDLRSRLQERGQTVWWHWYADACDAAATRKAANQADVYLMSSNAVTEKGELVNIDGNGNRVAALIDGPQTVFVIAGKNKITSDAMHAVARIKSVACPQNARRLSLQTPCAVTGKCSDCKSPDRMCNITVNFQYPPKGRQIHVLLVNEDLGY